VQISRECTPSDLSTGISNLFQPAQAEVVLGQRSTYLASWVQTDSYKDPSNTRRNPNTEGGVWRVEERTYVPERKNSN
jgi:hypothetical protein